MSTWKAISNWADGMEARRAKRAERRMPLLTYTQFHSGVASLFGDICSLTEHNFTLLIQRLNELLNKKLSDITVALKEVLDDRINKLAAWQDGGFQAAEYAATARFKSAEEASKRRTSLIIKFFTGLFGQIHSMDLNNSERYLELQESVRRLSLKVDNQTDVTLNTQIALFERMTDMLQGTPTLEWLFKNSAEITNLGRAFQALKENMIPPDMARTEILKCVRQIGSYEVESVQAAIQALATEHGVG